MRMMIAGFVALMVFAGCVPEDRMTGGEIAAFLEGNTIVYESGAGDYYDGRGNLTYRNGDRYGSARYSFGEDRICFAYTGNRSDCWFYTNTTDPLIKTVKRESDGVTWNVRLLGKGNLLSQLK